jgi:hypothetical protein
LTASPFTHIGVVFDTLVPVPRADADATLPERSTAVKAVYNARRKLSATQWRVYAVEHMLPGALVQGHPGMGALLQTFYRKRRDADNGHAALTNAAESGSAWRVGQVRGADALWCSAPAGRASRLRDAALTALADLLLIQRSEVGVQVMAICCCGVRNGQGVSTHKAAAARRAGDAARPGRPVAVPHRPP